jgi:hypothetical protein
MKLFDEQLEHLVKEALAEDMATVIISTLSLYSCRQKRQGCFKNKTGWNISRC